MKNVLIAVLLIFLSGCSGISKVITVANPSMTPTPILIENTSSPTITITLTPTQIPPEISNEFCNAEEANAAIVKLLELAGDQTNGEPTQESTITTQSTPGNEGSRITEAQRLLIVAVIDAKRIELTLLSVPKCLLPAKEHLLNSFSSMIQLMTPDENRINSDIFELLIQVSQEQDAFENEITRIQNCLPSGCDLVQE